MAAQLDADNPFGSLISVVAGDIMDAAATAHELKTAQSYRNGIRAVFAGAEAIVWYMKALSLQVAKRSPAVYSSFEMAALRDETYTVGANGKVTTRPNFVPISTSLKLVVSILARGQISNADLRLDQSSMDTLKESLKVRHRLTHPKSAADMDATESDFHQSMGSWAVVLTVGLNAAIEADRRLGTGVFPIKRADKTPS